MGSFKLRGRWLGLVAAGLIAGAAIVRGSGLVWPAILCAGVLVILAVMVGRRGRNGTVASVKGAVAGAMAGLPDEVRSVFETLPDPLLLLDKAGRVLFVNAAMRGLIGGDADRKHVSAVLRTPALLEAIEHTAATGQTANIQFTLPVPIERHFSAHVSRTHVSRTTAEPQIVIVLLHDLTAMKRAEQMRADFVANASHELRTPLAAVSGFIDTLKGHARDDEEARDRFLDIMSAEAGRMRRLIDDLLSLTRIELNEHVPPSEEVSLPDVLGEVVNALSPLAQKDSVSIAFDAALDLPPVVGDRDELAQLFQNLVHNAIKYGRPAGQVRLDARLVPPQGPRDAPDMVCVSVRDEGEGIPRDAIPRLTERFYRVDVKRSREKGGTGLGLAIVKHIISRHHGRLQIESEPGKGSTFSVFLPARPAAAQPADAIVTEVL